MLLHRDYAMRVAELFEGISDIVFHRTGFNNLIQILEKNQFELRPTFAKRSEQETTRKRKDRYFMSTARTKNSKYISDSRTPVLTLDGRKLKQNYSGYGMDYFGPSFREFDGGNYEQEDRIFSENPNIPNAKKYILQIEIVMEYNADQADRIFKIYTQAKKSSIPIKFYDSIPDRNTGNKPLPEEQVRAELKRNLAKVDRMRPYTPPKRPMYVSDAVPAIFLGLKFGPEDNIPADVKPRIDEFLRAWRGMDKGSVRADFHNAAAQEKHRNLITKIGAYMKKHNLSTIEELAEFVYQKWTNNQ